MAMSKPNEWFSSHCQCSCYAHKSKQTRAKLIEATSNTSKFLHPKIVQNVHQEHLIAHQDLLIRVDRFYQNHNYLVIKIIDFYQNPCYCNWHRSIILAHKIVLNRKTRCNNIDRVERVGKNLLNPTPLKVLHSISSNEKMIHFVNCLNKSWLHKSLARVM